MNPLDQVTGLRLAFDKHRELELGKRGAGRSLDVIDQSTCSFERQHPRGRDARVAEQVRTRATHPYGTHLAYPVNALDGGAQLFFDIGRRAVDEDVPRAPGHASC